MYIATCKTCITVGMNVIASCESKFQSFSTIRHINCEILLPTTVTSCAHCTNHRKSLNAMLSRYHQKLKSVNPNTGINSHTNYRYLSSNDKNTRIHTLHNALQISKRQIKQLKDKMDTKNCKHIAVSKDIHENLLETIKVHSDEITKAYPENSFPNLFWQQQIQAASVKDSRTMKWHPLMIKWCLYLQHKSSGAYELVRDSGQPYFRCI